MKNIQSETSDKLSRKFTFAHPKKNGDNSPRDTRKKIGNIQREMPDIIFR
jgi:hypothetical protein